MNTLSENTKSRIAKALGREVGEIPDMEGNPEAWSVMLDELRQVSPGLYRSLLQEINAVEKRKSGGIGNIKTRTVKGLSRLFYVEVEGEKAPNKKAYMLSLVAVLLVFALGAFSYMGASPNKGKGSKQRTVRVGSGKVDGLLGQVEVVNVGEEGTAKQEGSSGSATGEAKAEVASTEQAGEGKKDVGTSGQNQGVSSEKGTSEILVDNTGRGLPPLEGPAANPSYRRGDYSGAYGEGDYYGQQGGSMPVGFKGVLSDENASMAVKAAGKKSRMLIYESKSGDMRELGGAN